MRKRRSLVTTAGLWVIKMPSWSKIKRLGWYHLLVICEAPTDSTVLICGKSGTGKELVLRGLRALELLPHGRE
jgi:hypothetical protein